MRYLDKTLYFSLFLLLNCHILPAGDLHHYVFFELERERIAEPSFLETTAFEGAQLKYTWRELEADEGIYAFQAIQHDLDFLTAHGKKLFIQLQDVSFDSTVILVPHYLLEEEKYRGGADKQYSYEEGKEDQATPAGWVARRWDPAVRERFHQLLFALGKEFDGKIAGINLPETAVDFGETGRLFPKGFTPEIYRDAIIANMLALKKAFPTSVTILYANFMPGEWLPWNDHGYLQNVCQMAQALGLGLGGPDLLPYKPGQMNHCYRFVKEYAGQTPTGVAVQWDNYKHINPQTGREITIAELIQFATDYLHLDYLFWCTQEPFYSEKVLPFLNGKK